MIYQDILPQIKEHIASFYRISTFQNILYFEMNSQICIILFSINDEINFLFVLILVLRLFHLSLLQKV
ncbi:hypothetical protein COD23_08655 [Bacillus thuringiensis]|nr:hypothetical protein COD23_08655 [Bacillus thuringiensis]